MGWRQRVYGAVHRLAYRAYVWLDTFVNARWYSNPYGNEPLASPNEYMRWASEAAGSTPSAISDYEKELGFSIERDWLDNLALYTQIVKKDSRLSYVHGCIVYAVLRNYAQSASPGRLNIVETGTARGFSAVCMAKALHDSGVEGLITTFDIVPHHIPMIWNSIDDHDGPKSRSQILSRWQPLVDRYILFHQGYSRLELPKVQLDRIHLAFLDGAHGYNDVMFEFYQIKDKQLSGDIIIYDDYNSVLFPGLVKAVDEICAKYSYLRRDIRTDNDRSYVVATKQ